jgi:predicted RNase H-like HicB family nuclease
MSEFYPNLQVEPLEEGGYLAMSSDLQGLVAQGRTVAETIEIAQDVARKLVESRVEHRDPLSGLRGSTRALRLREKLIEYRTEERKGEKHNRQ